MLKKKQAKNRNKPFTKVSQYFVGSVYAKVNTVLAGIGILVFIYSGIFSPYTANHPIPSMYQQPVASTGLSRAFSAIGRGEFSLANQLNPFALNLFLFFFIQVIMRFFVNYFLVTNTASKNLLLYSDIILSVLLFLWAFVELILFQIKETGLFFYYKL